MTFLWSSGSGLGDVCAQSIQSARISFQSSELGHPPSHPQGIVAPPPLGPRGETHSLGGEGAGRTNSDEGTDTLVFYVHNNPSTSMRITYMSLIIPGVVWDLCVDPWVVGSATALAPAHHAGQNTLFKPIIFLLAFSFLSVFPLTCTLSNNFIPLHFQTMSHGNQPNVKGLSLRIKTGQMWWCCVFKVLLRPAATALVPTWSGLPHSAEEGKLAYYRPVKLHIGWTSWTPNLLQIKPFYKIYI